MGFYIKKTLISLISGISSGFQFCGGVLGGFFYSFSHSVKVADYFILKNFIVPPYKLFWRAKRKIKEIGGINETGGNFSLGAYYFTLCLLAVIGVFFAWSSVIMAQPKDEISEKKSLIFLVEGDAEEEELVLVEANFDKKEYETTAPHSYFSGVPALGYGDASAGIAIDCDICDESEGPIAVLGDSALAPPTMALIEGGKNGKTRREIVEYEVRQGDSLSSIARQFSLNVNTLLWVNNLYSWSVIRSGQKLVIPPVDGLLHKIKKGETLSKIVKQYKVDVNQVLAYNDIDEGEVLTVGLQIVIPGAKKAVYPYYQGAYGGRAILIPPAVPGVSGLVWPVTTRRITQYFSWRHSGIDIGAPYGSPVYALLGGEVEYVGWGRGYGWQIVVKHGNGMRTRYAHNSVLLVKKGEPVITGQVIAKIGSSGWSTGPHLHLEIYFNGRRVNPLQYLR